MISFASDYIAGAHPKVLEALVRTNLEVQTGYGTDEYCASAREKIKKACECESADVHFLVGGTQTNAIVVAAMLKPFEGVISAPTGHINAHESGAVEYTGHKILPVAHKEGKIIPEALQSIWKPSTATRTVSIWSIPEWSTFLTPPSTELFILKRSLRRSRLPVKNTECPFSLTEPVLDTDL